jgi:predicted nucleotidyltransferase
MTVTAEDYDLTFARFAEDLRRLGSEIRSVIRFGSIARGNLSPGKSDIMDAYVFLAKETFASEDAFSRVMLGFAETCRWFSETGLPFHHPFHYYCEDEVKNLPAGFVSALKAEDESDVFFGEDIRPGLGSSAKSLQVMRPAFFLHLAGLIFRLGHFQRMDHLNEDQRRTVVAQLSNYSKHVPQSVTLALGRELGGEAALQYLRERFPGADLAVLAEARSTREGNLPSSDELQRLLGRVLTLIETLHHEVVAGLRVEFDQEWTGLSNV